MDDRLACRRGTSQLLSTKPTPDKEVWPLILEKAFCIHAGGWDKIDGGQSTVALAILTGCMESYTIKKNAEGSYTCNLPKGGYQSFKGNSPHDGSGYSTSAAWPITGGTAAKTPDEFFNFLEECDKKNFVVCAGTGAGAPTSAPLGPGPPLSHLQRGWDSPPFHIRSAAGVGWSRCAQS